MWPLTLPLPHTNTHTNPGLRARSVGAHGTDFDEHPLALITEISTCYFHVSAQERWEANSAHGFQLFSVLADT